MQAQLDHILAGDLRCVGIVGLPPRWLIARLAQAQTEIHDLDALLPAAAGTAIPDLLPRVYCGILRTVVLNAVHLRRQLQAIFIDIGPGKCDGARYTAEILRRQLDLPVLTCHNLDQEPAGHPICRSGLPLVAKLQQITEGVKQPQPPPNPPAAAPPTAGFWGVPPRDFRLLENFPDTTHVYGWSRCLENKTPADQQLEMHCRQEVPTVFFAQSFCPKTALARDLAAAHPRALYLDADLHGGASIRAKIEAFLELSGAGP